MSSSSQGSAAQKRPLAGLRILVGRARHQASQLSAGLKALGAVVIEIPFIEIRPPGSYKPLDSALKNIAQYDWLILTSVNGVNAIGARLKRLNINPSVLKRVKIAAIGPATREQIESLGLKVALVPKKYVAESVVESLRGKVEGKCVLLARAKVARDVIPRELRKLGAKVDVVEAYQTVVPQSCARRLQIVMSSVKEKPDVICFTSSSAVKNFVELIKSCPAPIQDVLIGIKLASIGPVTSASLRELVLPVHIEARQYTIPGLIRAIKARKR